MICNKGRGSLEKHPGRTGIFGYGPLDRDLTAQDGSGLDLIWRADSGSGGQGWVGARDGGAGHRSPLLRGGATRGSPDFGVLGVPGLGLGRGLAVGHHHGMRKALVAMGRWFGAPSVTLLGDGGSAAQGSPVLARSGS